MNVETFMSNLQTCGPVYLEVFSADELKVFNQAIQNELSRRIESDPAPDNRMEHFFY